MVPVCLGEVSGLAGEQMGEGGGEKSGERWGGGVPSTGKSYRV